MIDGLPLLYWCRNLGKSGQDPLDNIVGIGTELKRNCMRDDIQL